MESLGDEPWDVVINGTGLQQSLLALALSRSKKRVLHVDPNDFYGQHEAALSLQEAENWVAGHKQPGQDPSPLEEPLGPPKVSLEDGGGSAAEEGPGTPESGKGGKPMVFRNASCWTHPEAEANGLSFPRAYSLALAPQIIHTRSNLLAQLVSSKAFRQVEFLAVGSFFVYEPTKDPILSRIPSSREDVFSNQSISAKSKRTLMKFLKFVLDFDSEENLPTWQGQADSLLSGFLDAQFHLDNELRKLILALTLTLDGQISVIDGLTTLKRHLTSLGLFGPGFCAVYPKWGGLSEVAQVGCRAGAVGGGIYMLDTGFESKPGENDMLSLDLSNGMTIQAKAMVCEQGAGAGRTKVSRLITVVNSPLQSLFEVTVEGAPSPAVAVVAFPSGTGSGAEATEDEAPMYAMVHSDESGECPKGQSVIYLCTPAKPGAKQKLADALESLLKATRGDGPAPLVLFKMYFEQTTSTATTPSTEPIGTTPSFAFPSVPLRLAFDDSVMDQVKAGWKFILGDEASEDDYMVFEDREGADAEDEAAYE